MKKQEILLNASCVNWCADECLYYYVKQESIFVQIMIETTSL